jgi:hypothetical protein
MVRKNHREKALRPENGVREEGVKSFDLEPTMSHVKSALACCLLFITAAVCAADKDPLSKYSDEQLAKIDFCFEKFCEAVAAKDVTIAMAFMEEVPRGMQKLDPKKPADQAAILKQLEKFVGASVTGSQKLGFTRVGQITFKAKTGKEDTQQMRNVGGRWKLCNL